MSVGLVDGGDRRRNSGEHRVGGQPVAGILHGEEGKQAAEEQQAAKPVLEHFQSFILCCPGPKQFMLPLLALDVVIVYYLVNLQE